MKFLTKAHGFDRALASASNYPDGHILKNDGSPAVFVFKNKIDLGLRQCRDVLLQEMHSGNATPARVYSNQNFTTIDENSRSTLVAHSRNEYLRAAYNSLDLGFRDVVLHETKCSSFAFKELGLKSGFEQDCCQAPTIGENIYHVLERQQLIYQTNDHFGNRNDSHNAHADDSLFRDGVWIRNNIPRHFVGLLYLTDQVEKENVTNENHLFSGGDLIFPHISEDGINQLVIKPKFGMLVYFPASPLYAHGVPKITRGTRLVVTTWFTVPCYA